MTKPLAFLSAVLVAAALAVPTVSAAQGSRRGGGDSGSSGGGRSGSGDGGVAVPRESPPPAPRAESPSPSSEGGPVTRSSPSSGDSSGSNRATGRTRSNQAVRGYAQPRTYSPGGSHNVVVWPSWYYPYYGAYFGYSSYPYGYWNRYGWYDPFLFDPFGFGYYGAVPYYYPPSVTYSTRDEERERTSTGSIRFKVNPKSAKVYIDGALAGTVDEFDGLSDHLELTSGSHQLELRADGYKSYTGTLDVKEGQTRTTRVSLDKQ
jgi:hypothetical protein